jgi:protein arginine kinase activator
MQCDVCQKIDATVFFSQIHKGEVHKVNLCKGCAKEQNVTDPTGFQLAEMLWGMGSHEITAQPREKACPACGLPHHVFRKSGRLGCSQCYEMFSENVGNLLKTMHKGSQHLGKQPFGWQPPLTTAPPLVPLVEQPELDLQPAATPSAPSAPAAPTALENMANNIHALLAALNLAVAHEQYEEAARLRDEISRLEQAAPHVV